LRKTLGLGGAAGVGVAANIFLGHVESPLLIKPYLKQVSRSDLFLIMTAGMATIAGTIMVIYASILSTVIPGCLGATPDRLADQRPRRRHGGADHDPR
jgi:CNT family concentrative nucleoside transporter